MSGWRQLQAGGRRDWNVQNTQACFASSLKPEDAEKLSLRTDSLDGIATDKHIICLLRYVLKPPNYFENREFGLLSWGEKYGARGHTFRNITILPSVCCLYRNLSAVCLKA